MPKMRMSTSRDGKSFNNELTRSIGGVGQFEQRQVFYRLGRFPRMMGIKVVMSDAVKPVFIKLEATIRANNRGR